MHLISSKQFSECKHLDNFFNIVDDLSKHIFCLEEWVGFNPWQRNKQMACLFYEPSTRTRFSFESAIHKWHGTVISESNVNNLSSAKGESLEDTIRTIGEYADVIVLRHPEKNVMQRVVKVTNTPIINAGDGNGEHPTQSLLDLYTIRQAYKMRGDFTKAHVLVCGDLKNSRTVHSLLHLLNLYEMKVSCYCPKGFELPFGNFTYYKSLEEGLSTKPNVVYMTRPQRERFLYSGVDVRDPFANYCLTPELLNILDKDAIVLHPLPRTRELPIEIDDDRRCLYFVKQIQNGLKVRMGLLYCVFSKNILWSGHNNYNE